MAEFCGVCNCKIGLFTGKVKFRDGSVCTKCYTEAGYSTWNTNEMVSMQSVTIDFWKETNELKKNASK